MSMDSLDENAATEIEADMQADAITDRLRKDVASWRGGRVDGASREATELSVAVAKPVPAPRAKRARPVAAAVPDAKKKPFGMSYDGSSNADYINYMISRGAR